MEPNEPEVVFSDAGRRALQTWLDTSRENRATIPAPLLRAIHRGRKGKPCGLDELSALASVARQLLDDPDVSGGDKAIANAITTDIEQHYRIFSMGPFGIALGERFDGEPQFGHVH